jgi:hypothetical protein
MFRKLILTAAVFVVIGVLTFMAGWASDSQSVALPATITANTPCPVAGCTQPDKGCHAATAYPVPDGSFEMQCPRAKGCADIQCHAWDRIDATRDKPSDASLNLWILVPVLFTVGLVLIVQKSR